MTQNVISTYGDMWLMKAALEKAGKADRLAVAQAFRTMDGGPSKYYPGGQLKFDEKGRRVGAGVVIVQWQIRRTRHRLSVRPRTSRSVLAEESPDRNVISKHFREE